MQLLNDITRLPNYAIAQCARRAPCGFKRAAPSADCVRVGRAAAFAQVLDEKLREFDGGAGCRQPPPGARGFALPHPLLFASAYHSTRQSLYASSRPRVAAARALTADEQRALDALNACGAKLTANFTAAELRSAYRALARTYHPDRLASLPDNERVHWSQTFAEIATSYGLLARFRSS